MDKKLQQLFEYQKFENNEALSEAIEKCEEAYRTAKQKQKLTRVHRKIAVTMTASVAAAAFFLVINSVFVNGHIETGGTTGIASVFSGNGNGLMVAGTILAFGIITSIILYIKGKGSRKT